MLINQQDSKPIYQQIAEIIEDQILLGNLKQEDRVYSTNELAKKFRVNPATAGKGLNVLIQEGILYKKRGLGMFVSQSAAQYIKQKRVRHFEENYIDGLIAEAKKLGLDQKTVIKMITKRDWRE